MPGAAVRHSRADSDTTVASNSGSLPITRRDQAELTPGDPQGRGSQIWEPAYSAVRPDAASVEQDRPVIPERSAPDGWPHRARRANCAIDPAGACRLRN